MRRTGLIAAVVLVIAVNGIVLAGVGFNRSGPPDSSIELTEREARLVGWNDENSAVTMRLAWNRHPYDEDERSWFDAARLTAVGFDCRKPLDAPDAELHYAKMLPRKAHVVLEYEGRAWTDKLERDQRELARLKAELSAGKVTAKAVEDAARRAARERESASRLLAVDAGSDPVALRGRYPDRSRFMIVPAQVRLHYIGPARGAKQRRLGGSIERIMVDTLEVPLHLRQGLVALRREGTRNVGDSYPPGGSYEKPNIPRYRIRVNGGRRYEPWVSDIRMMERDKK